MGYTTDFWGEFDVEPPLTNEHRAYLTAFAGTRRMKRNAEITATYPDPLREAVGLPVGEDGGYYVGDTADFGQTPSPDVVDYNAPPGAMPYEIRRETFGSDFQKGWEEERRRIAAGEQQPGLWCQWIPDESGTAIRWDEGEKFYEYVPWIRYLIEHFLKPWGYTLNGEVEWSGEETDDRGKIVVTNNEVTVLVGRIRFVKES